MSPLDEKMLAPNFALIDQEGKSHSLKDYEGKYLLLYFYPKDMTPGCTKQACNLRDHFDLLSQKGVVILGISSDTPESHHKFQEKYHLPFLLLCDPKKEVISLYGARAGPVPKRISYLIDPEGKIIKVYKKINPAHHAEEVLQDLSEIERLSS